MSNFIVEFYRSPDGKSPIDDFIKSSLEKCKLRYFDHCNYWLNTVMH